MDNTWRVDVRTGWIVGLAIAVILIGGTVGLIVAAVMAPLSLRVFLLGLGACLTLALAIRVLYQLWGLINASYKLDRNALTIHWGPVEHQVPMGSVQDVVSGARLQQLRVRPSLRWPGYFVALGRASGIEAGERASDGSADTATTVQGASDSEAGSNSEAGDSDATTEAAADNGSAELDPILFYATKRPKKQIILQTKGMAYGISPADFDEFLPALHERLAMGPTQEVEERSTRPGFLRWSIWRDRWALGMLVGSFAGLVLLVGLLCWRYPFLPAEVALRFKPNGEPLLIGQASRVFYFALVGTIFFVVNGTLGILFYKRERPLSYFLWSGLVAAVGGLWAAVVSILLMQ
ncbi:MAG: PH domain-containing protein [Anaerolineae bacterium]